MDPVWRLFAAFGRGGGLFGQTYGGGNNIAYPTVWDSALKWEANWGPQLTNNPQTIDKYVSALNSKPGHTGRPQCGRSVLAAPCSYIFCQDGAMPREPLPIKLESGPMPADDSFWLNQNQRPLPP